MKTQCILVGYVNEIVPQLGRSSLVKTETLSCLSKRLRKNWILKTEFYLTGLSAFQVLELLFLLTYIFTGSTVSFGYLSFDTFICFR